MAAVVSSDARVSGNTDDAAAGVNDVAAGDATDAAAGTDDTPVSDAEKARQEEPVQSNQIPGWPQGPVISAETAILLDANTGAVLYAKNIHQKMYPASTTKMLTCLIAAEKLQMDDTVTFSHSAVHDVPADGSNVGMDEGETITVEQCLYGIMVGSANECASAIAEKVAGSVDAFTDLMNEKAKELGCTDSHFANANGLFREDHYTSAHDLALIGKAFFENKNLLKIGNTPRYHFEKTATQPDDFWVENHNLLINGQISCAGIIGGKTGYTDQSGRTLVTGCERNGMRLVCVVMKEDDPKQFEDTVTLFDYGYSNFTQVSPADEDTSFSLAGAKFLTEGEDILGSSVPAISIAEGSLVDLPSGTSFRELSSDIGSDNVITYSFGSGQNTTVVGKAALFIAAKTADSGKDSAKTNVAAQSGSANTSFLQRLRSLFYTVGSRGTIYIRVIPILIAICGAGLLVLLICLFIRLIRSYNYSFVHKDRRRRSRLYRRQGHTDYYENHRYDRNYDDAYDSNYDFDDSSWDH